jgi:hypothetical protein
LFYFASDIDILGVLFHISMSVLIEHASLE